MAGYLFAGDSAHQVSPFGARGANSGIQDVDNLCWKLKLVIDGVAPGRLLDTYSEERVHGADENILNSTRATDFITPKSEISRVFRDAVLDLAERLPFARTLVNSGRLSVPCTYDDGPLNGADDPAMPARTRPGAPLPDAPLAEGWLLDRLGVGFQILTIDAEAPKSVTAHGVTATRVAVSAGAMMPCAPLSGRRARGRLSNPPRPACRCPLEELRRGRRLGGHRQGHRPVVKEARMTVITTSNVDRPDDFYALLIAAHEGLTREESEALNARLILILANHIGDSATLKEALELAKG